MYFGIVFLILFALLQSLVSANADLDQLIPVLIMATYFALMDGVAIFVALRFKAINLRRQAAAGRGGLLIPLAAAQPIPNDAALPLPFTITLGPGRGRSFAIGGGLSLLFPLAFLLLTFTSGLDSPGNLNTTFTITLYALILGITIGFAILISVVLIWTGHQQITATEEELTVRQGTRIYHTSWREARLFAITRSVKRTGPPTFYELSGAATFTLLIRLRQGTLFPPNFKPALPFDEYDRQMDALLSLIAAKTGLPLYDLR